MRWREWGLRPAARRIARPVLLALACLATWALAPEGTSAAWAGSGPGVVQVQSGVRGRPIPSGFIGLALEYHAVVQYAGQGAGAPNPVLVQLIRNLDPGQAPVLRIGGDSTDWTWYPLRGRRPPPGVSFSLTPAWMAATRALVQELGARLILGINLEAGSPLIAGAEARALVNGLGRGHVQALELGNEPELYGYLPWTHTASGRPIPGRPAGYSIANYLSDVSRVRSRLPAVPLAEPATGNFQWLDALPTILAADPGVRMVTFHRYPLDRCQRNPAAPDYPSVPHLLARRAVQGLLPGIGPFVSLAHRGRLSFRIGEMNTVTCGGVKGISNTFASALWALGAMLQVARQGVDGVNIETSPFPGYENQLFTFHRGRGQWKGWVWPEYYGLYLFAQTAPPGSRFLPVASGAGPQVSAWAVRTPSRQVHVVLINDALQHAHTVQVRLPGPAATAPAALETLTASGPYATTGITLGGQAFPPGSTTGTLPAPPATVPVAPSRGGYAVQLPASSAAVLTLP